MKNALIGSTGFVGSSLLNQHTFECCYSSANIADIDGRQFGIVVCAAAPGQKWLANKQPDADRQNIEGLIARLKTVSCGTFILISTVDVFKHPVRVDELTPVDKDGLHAYGLNRHMIEEFVASHYASHLIVRLPGLVGPGLRKNIVYDFVHDNNLDAIDSRGIFQFYPMPNLWNDLSAARHAGLNLVHLTAETVSVADICQLAFDRPFSQEVVANPAVYDMRTRHAGVFGARGNYQYTRQQSIEAIRAYARDEKATPQSQPGPNP